MKTVGKDFFARRVITCELVAFTLTIALIWLDEFADVSYLLLGAEKTPVNWRESLFETLLITPIALTIIYYTKMLFSRMKYLEGFLPICSSCKKIRDEQGNWQQMESYIHDRSEARFSHGICPHCAKRLYPEVFTENDDPEDISQIANNHKERHYQSNL
jgi:hypothetical protein